MERIRLTKEGNVGIGTTSPAMTLDVKGNVNVTGDFWWGAGSLLSPDQGGIIELGGRNKMGHTRMPYIDFHYKDDEDFNVRIANDGDGQLSLISTNVKVSGQLQIAGSVTLAAPNTEIYNFGLSRKDEDGRIHEWRLWHMNSQYRKNSLEIWEYKTDSHGIACKGVASEGAMCTPRLVIAEGGNVGIGTVDLKGYRLNVAGKLDQWQNLLFLSGDTAVRGRDLLTFVKFGIDGDYQFLHKAAGHFGRNTLALHCEANDAIGFYSTGWKPLLEVAGDSGHVYIEGDLLVKGRISSYNRPANPIKASWGGGLRTWDIEAEGTIWSKSGIDTAPHDMAEIFFSDLGLEAGDVVSLDPLADRITLSSKAYDTHLIGIISTEPGVTLNSQPRSETDLTGYPVALCGCVPCKVNVENGIIRRGDLLVASSKPGYAMRAKADDAGAEVTQMCGAVVGKALSDHSEGEGVIEVFVMLR